MTVHDDASQEPWLTRAEQPGDAPAIREVPCATFPTELGADLVETLREDPVVLTYPSACGV